MQQSLSGGWESCAMLADDGVSMCSEPIGVTEGENEKRAVKEFR